MAKGLDINTQDYSEEAVNVQPGEINAWKKEIGTKVVAVTGTYQALEDDGIILANGTFTITLPAVASSNNKRLRIINIGDGVITIDGKDAEEIDGKSSVTISAKNSSLTFVSDGSDWFTSDNQPKPIGNSIITVAKAGNVDFSSADSDTPIQDAIDSITDATNTKRYAISIAPGVYEENIIGKNYVSLIGQGYLNKDTVIKATSGELYTAPNTFSSIDNITLLMEVTTSDCTVFKATNGGEHVMDRGFLIMTSDTNGVTGKLLDVDCDKFYYLRSDLTYIMTGSSAGSNTHNLCILSGSTTFAFNTAENIISVGDIDDDVNMIVSDASGGFVLANAITTIVATNASYTGTMTAIKITKNTEYKFPTQNLFFILGNGSGTGYGIYIDTDNDDGQVDTGYNLFTIVGFTNNYYAHAGVGDTVRSQADLITADGNITGDGNIDFINTQEYGQLQITGGGVFTIDAADEWHAFLGMSEGVVSDHVDVHTGLTGAITAFADAGGGQVTVTSAGHGIVDEGEYVSITGTTNYNDIYQITNITTDTFEITETFNGDDATGTFIYGDHIVARRRGAYRLSWSFSASAASANQVFDFAAYNGTTKIDGTQLQRKFQTAGAVGVMSSSPVIFLEKDEVLFFAIRNTTSAGNISISEGTFNINKIS